MADDIQVEITGLADIERQLTEMGAKFARKALRKAAKSAGQVLAEAQRMRAPVGPGNDKDPSGTLRDSVAVVTKVSPTNQEVAVIVGPTRHAFWGMFDEFGTSRQAAKPWIVPAFEESAETALDVLIASLQNDLPEIISDKS